jgi:hypothetical protein
MNTKLTLTIEQNVIDKAKKYAKKKGHSLSDIVENYLKVITKNEPNQEIEYTPLVKSLLGTFKAPNNFDYKKELAKSLSNKYLHYCPVKVILKQPEVILYRELKFFKIFFDLKSQIKFFRAVLSYEYRQNYPFANFGLCFKI